MAENRCRGLRPRPPVVRDRACIVSTQTGQRQQRRDGVETDKEIGDDTTRQQDESTLSKGRQHHGLTGKRSDMKPPRDHEQELSAQRHRSVSEACCLHNFTQPGSRRHALQ